MSNRLLLFALFFAAVVLAVAGWAVDGARWLVIRPARRLRGREELPQGRLAG
jgi:hypothetical protein